MSGREILVWWIGKWVKRFDSIMPPIGCFVRELYIDTLREA